jgi:predicted enzyme related to lactoylglutathione lyase
MKYLHTNLTVTDLEMISGFYQKVFGCVPVRAPQDLSGAWLGDITGVEDATIRYVHLRLPGYGPDGPELELIQYASGLDQPRKVADASGFGHISFAVDDVQETLNAVIAAGGSAINKVVTVDIPNRGRLTEVYATDPEGNIIELQHYA